ncbi:MAG: hypothetical protein M1837_001283 [Sclerophora amabilis]|nr:MAG: hypothetical protein M1837_001283 [Sclerophora amabilis]
MLAARDKENLVHNHQTTAATKPLNQGNKQAPPKTPGNRAPKTPFKVSLNDENAATGFDAGKPVLKTNGKGLGNVGAGGKKAGPGDKNAFITPLGPRNRAPLGLKTTNAKAKAFQTPAPSLHRVSIKDEDPPLKSNNAGKSKPQIAPVRTTKVELQDRPDEVNLDEERDIEYMPPKPKDLPDYPDDFPPDMDYSQLKGANLTRGWYSHFCNPVDEHGVSLSERRSREQSEKIDKEIEELSWRIIEEMPIIGHNVPEYPGDETDLKLARKRQGQVPQKKMTSTGRNLKSSVDVPASEKAPVSESGSSSAKLSSIEAASVLGKQAPQPKPKLNTGLTRNTTPSTFSSRSKQVSKPVKASNDAASASATSRNTLGYAAGRKAAVVTSIHNNPSQPASKISQTSKPNHGTGKPSRPNSTKSNTLASSNTFPSLEHCLSVFPQKAGVPLYASKEEWERHEYPDGKSTSFLRDSFDNEDGEEEGLVGSGMRGLLGPDEMTLQQLLLDEADDDFQLVWKEPA